MDEEVEPTVNALSTKGNVIVSAECTIGPKDKPVKLFLQVGGDDSAECANVVKKTLAVFGVPV